MMARFQSESLIDIVRPAKFNDILENAPEDVFND